MRQLKITKSITNRESASLDKYLQEIGREDLITVEEEVELAQAIKRGDRRALERLRNLMKPEGLSSFLMLYGGFVSLFCRLWQNSRELFVFR